MAIGVTLQPPAWGDLDDVAGLEPQRLHQVERRLVAQREQLPLHDLSLNGHRQLLERRLARPVGGELIDAVGRVAGKLHRLQHLAAHRRAILFGQSRQQLVANAVAEKAGVAIRRVVSIRDPLPRRVFGNLGATNAEQRPNQRHAGVGG